jgi:2-desacetyl-2-hydroxyethyl bacteriochlorophyllide A dehydrogenase
MSAVPDPLVAQALWITEPGVATLRAERLAAPEAHQVLVRTLYSGISRGTERLVFRAQVPAELHDRMACPHQGGSLSLPVKYGYCSVGRVIDGPADWRGRRVFCLHPHQDYYVVAAADVVALPDSLPSARAVLTANMETALNALWDGAVGPGFRVAVVGAGAVGLLLASLVARLPGVELEVVDPDPSRALVCEQLGLTLRSARDARRNCDRVFHCSGHPSGLAIALGLAGFEAQILELSWYGATPVTLPLGEHFHSSRLQIVSSQVAHVAPVQRARWDGQRRKALALRLLDDPRYDALLAAPIPFTSAPSAWPHVLGDGASGVAHLLEYP